MMGVTVTPWKGAADGEWLRAVDKCRAGHLGAAYAVEDRRERLPVGKQFRGVLEIAAEEAGADVIGEHAAGVDAALEEGEAATIVGKADATLEHDAVVVRLPLGGSVEWVFSRLLRVQGRQKQGERQAREESSHGGAQPAIAASSKSKFE